MNGHLFMVIDMVNTFCKSDVRFVQIGGNDGLLEDPVNRYIGTRNWKGIIVEPIPDYFEKLKQTYKDFPSVNLINAAIDPSGKQKRMYKVSQERIDLQLANENHTWLQGCASFNRDHLLDMNVQEDEIETVMVNTMTGKDLVSGFGDCDLLLIDVEGAEDIVLQSFDFSVWKPKVIVFESAYIVKQNKMQFVVEYLVKAGYNVVSSQPEAFAVLPHYISVL